MIEFGDLKDWDAAQVGQAGDLLKDDLDKLEAASDALRDRAIPGSWIGLAATAARVQQSVLVGQMERHLSGARELVRVIYQAEGRVTAVHEDAVAIDHDATAHDFTVGRDGTVRDVSTPGMFRSATAAEAYTAERTRLRDALVARVEAALTEAYEIDALLVRAIPDNELGSDGPDPVVDPRVARTWEGLSDDERRAILTQISEELAEEYGIEVNVVFEDLEDQDGDGQPDDPGLDHRGFWRDSDRTLHIDVNDLARPDTIDTVAHEIRHALQHEMARDVDPSAWDDALISAGLKDDPWDPPDGITRDQAEEWKDNFGDYIEAEDDFDGYESQPVEADAREAGEEYLEGLTPEELERIRVEAR